MSDFDLTDRIELLVEGELSADERRRVLDQCENQPSHWKTLAIALLEQQKLREAVRLSHESPRIRMAPEPTYTTPKRHRWTKLLGLAACVAIAFTFGLKAGQGDSSDVSVADRTGAAEPTPNTPMRHIAGDSGMPDDADSTTPAPLNKEGIVGYVKWTGSGGDPRLSPVFVGEVDDQWLQEHPPQVDRQVQRMMSRAGWQVEPARRLVSVNLTSGDQFTIPMDDVQYRYIGRQVY